MAKYIIETNMTDDTFGAFIPANGCRNVGIDEMKGYYYWPGDVRGVFMILCNHVLPKTLTFCSGYEDAYIVATFSDTEHWLRFKRISDAEAKASGLKEFNHMKWIDQLREDKTTGTITSETMAKTIKIWNTRKNCAEYLYRLRPTRFIDDKALCLKMDDAEAQRASEWLNTIGINHEVIEVEGNH